MAAPAAAAARPSATISSTVSGMPGCRSRPQGPFSAASIQILLMNIRLFCSLSSPMDCRVLEKAMVHDRVRPQELHECYPAVFMMNGLPPPAPLLIQTLLDCRYP